MVIRIIVALILFVMVFLPLLTNGVNMLVDWLWFKQEGYRLIYLTILKSQINLSGIAGMGFMHRCRLESLHRPHSGAPASAAGLQRVH